MEIIKKYNLLKEKVKLAEKKGHLLEMIKLGLT